jgi:phage terminase small subunit
MNLDDLRSKIASWLEVRLLSIMTSSTFDEQQKSKYSNIVKQHINMFTNKNIKSVTVLSQFAEDIIPQLLSDLEEVRGIKETSDSYYMAMYHDNFSTYHKIFSEIQKTLNNPDYF